VTLPAVRVLFSADQIQARVRDLARAIDATYAGSENLVLVGVLRGSVYFLTDLSRALTTPHCIDFVEYASYHGTEKGAGRLVKACSGAIRGTDVLLVDEILDTGETIETLCDLLRADQPRSIRVCSLFVKEDSQTAPRAAEEPSVVADGRSRSEGTSSAGRRSTASGERPTPDFAGFRVGPEFLVGYGLDHDQRLRHLPYVGVIDDRPPGSGENAGINQS
jgi:hypoxanthine phosphoribosyltransferase